MIALARLLRAAAIAIAILGVVDPVFSWPRSERPTVALIDGGDATAASSIARGLAERFQVHRGAIANAAGTLVVGASLPSPAPAVSGVAIAAIPPVARRVWIDQIHMPSTARPGSRVPVAVTLKVHGAKGRKLHVDLSAGGVLFDRVTPVVATDDESIDVTLTSAALAPGLVAVAVRVADDAGGNELGAEAVVATEVQAAQWRVLVVDSRPSWMSTFVRRALEADRRFIVTSSVGTSRGLAAESGNAPVLTDVAALDTFSAIVVGAPDALTPEDVRALERFARSRGGAVVLLMDRLDSGAFARLTGASSWRDVHGTERRSLTAPSGNMLATELAVPVGLAPTSNVLSAATAADKSSIPVVWDAPLGAGQVIVSGALDAWRYRTRESSGFSRFWTQVVADGAASAPAPVSVWPSERVVSAGATIDVRVIVRSAQLSDASRPAPAVDVRASISPLNGGAEEFVRMWPTPERGVFAATVRVPDAPGPYRISALASSSNGAELGIGSADVLSGEPRAFTTRQDAPAWATAHGGVTLFDADAAAIGRVLDAQANAKASPSRVHPMRAWWWLPIFVAALGGEWWLRRQRGDR